MQYVPTFWGMVYIVGTFPIAWTQGIASLQGYFLWVEMAVATQRFASCDFNFQKYEENHRLFIGRMQYVPTFWEMVYIVGTFPIAWTRSIASLQMIYFNPYEIKNYLNPAPNLNIL